MSVNYGRRPAVPIRGEELAGKASLSVVAATSSVGAGGPPPRGMWRIVCAPGRYTFQTPSWGLQSLLKSHPTRCRLPLLPSVWEHRGIRTGVVSVRSNGIVGCSTRTKMHRAEISYVAKARRAKIFRGLTYVALAAMGVYGIMSFLEDKLMYYYTPTQALEKGLDITRKIRLGGVVVPGSVTTRVGTLAIDFVLTDFNLDISVTYTGLIPDLFREGQGCVCEGKMLEDGKFHAQTVLAKHDESYIPGDIAEEIQRTLEEKNRKQEQLDALLEEEAALGIAEVEIAPQASGWQSFQQAGGR